MKVILAIAAASLLSAGQILAHCGTCGVGGSHKDGCVKGEPCKCVDCGQVCGSEACKASKNCKGDGC
ncbi:MAG: hypothetical protein ACKO39_00165 [Chthoniobacterales bacterium]